MTLLVSFAAALFAQQPPAAPASPPALDYEFFKTRVQPIFLTKRPGSARCYICHRGTGGTNYLQLMPAGATVWSDEQSRMNFDSVRRYVVPGDPAKSRLLLHPLAEEAGGDDFHAGGRHWQTRDNPEYQTIAAWIRGQK